MIFSEIHKAKLALRKEIASRKKEHDRLELEDLSSKIMNHLEQTELFQSASCIALYHALPGEVQTKAFIEKWYKKKRILLPLVVGDDLQLHLYEGMSSVTVGSYGILEPKVESPIVAENEIDFIVVPGVAFDNQKNRMGRGKGFYDRLLSSLNIPKVGIAYNFQIVEKVPVEEFDKQMDYIITEDGIR